MEVLHRHLPANTVGKDYIVGDLHGCLDLLQEALVRAKFDFTRDRLFSVGDLIDRGPDSMGCLRLLNEPWFYAVRGNHEDMLLDYLENIPQPWGHSSVSELFLGNGGRWVRDFDAESSQELNRDLVPKVRALPYVITVGDGDRKFHVAHAELMTGRLDDRFQALLAGKPIDNADQHILTDDLVNDDVLDRMTEPLLWGRRLITTFQSKRVSRRVTPAGKLSVSKRAYRQGLALTYVGHTIVPRMILHESHFFIDRGGFLRSAESCLLMVCHEDVLAWVA